MVFFAASTRSQNLRKFSPSTPRTSSSECPRRSSSSVSLGSFEPFLVTIGPDAVGMRYEAVFT